MSISKEDIFNKALLIIGGPSQTSYIDNPETDKSTQAVWLRIVYDSALDYCAIDLKSGIFREYRALNQTSGSPESLDWSYVFDKPSESIHLVRITRADDRTKDYDFDDKGLYYFCDFENAIADIVISPESSEMARWPVGFHGMVSARMAMQVSAIWKPEMAAIAAASYDAARTEAFEMQPHYQPKTPIWNENT